jgi:hypothetical protein
VQFLPQRESFFATQFSNLQQPQKCCAPHERSGISKIEARLSYVDDKALLYLAEVLKVQVQELFPPENARKSNPRFHGETGDDPILKRDFLTEL